MPPVASVPESPPDVRKPLRPVSLSVRRPHYLGSRNFFGLWQCPQTSHRSPCPTRFASHPQHQCSPSFARLLFCRLLRSLSGSSSQAEPRDGADGSRCPAVWSVIGSPLLIYGVLRVENAAYQITAKVLSPFGSPLSPVSNSGHTSRHPNNLRRPDSHPASDPAAKDRCQYLGHGA